MSVNQRYGNWYVSIQARGLPSVRRRVEAMDKAQAQQIEAWVKLQLQAGVNEADLDFSPTSPRIPPKPKTTTLTLQEAYDRAMRDEWYNAPSIKTHYGPVGRAAVEMFGPDVDMAQATDEHIKEFVEECFDNGDRPRTVNARIALLVRIWNIATKKWKVQGLPTLNWGDYKVDQQKHRMRWVTEEEERNMLHILERTDRDHSDEMRDFVLILLDTGMRRGEALALRPTDYNSESNSITISRSNSGDTKNRETRTVPLRKRTRALLQARLELSDVRKHKRFFPHLNKDRIRRLWNYAKCQVGLKDDREFVPHACRHTCATRLIERGNDIRLVQHWLGHSDIETTSHYAKVTAKHLASGAESLDRQG